MNGRITKCVGGVFTVYDGEEFHTCVARKKIRHKKEDLMVGDYVVFCEYEQGLYSIEKRSARFNALKRPPLANIDQAVLVLAAEPLPDLLLLDKLAAYLTHAKVQIVLVYNKADLNNRELLQILKNDYSAYFRVLVVSAKTGEGMDALREMCQGKTTCFAGQSAVGKSSLLRKLLPEKQLEIGELSAKILRGKNTTRKSELYLLPDGGYVADTPGFSLFDLSEIDYRELHLYYPEFEPYNGKCRFDMCTHITEPDCAVKEAVRCGDVCQGRYRRYCEIFTELKAEFDRKY